MKNKIKNIMISSALISTSTFASVDVMMLQDDFRDISARSIAPLAQNTHDQEDALMFLLSVIKHYQTIEKER